MAKAKRSTTYLNETTVGILDSIGAESVSGAIELAANRYAYVVAAGEQRYGEMLGQVSRDRRLANDAIRVAGASCNLASIRDTDAALTALFGTLGLRGKQLRTLLSSEQIEKLMSLIIAADPSVHLVMLLQAVKPRDKALLAELEKGREAEIERAFIDAAQDGFTDQD